MISKANLSIGRDAPAWYLGAAMTMLLVLGGCGGDDPPPPAKNTTAAAPAQKKPARRGAEPPKTDELRFYPKVESFVADPEEAANIRHTFVPSDFEADGTGDINRDPFRSYIIRQPGTLRTSTEQSDVEPTKVCSGDKLVATDYPLRDLRLVGIALRGTRSYALFRDTKNYGHIITKGDCVGQEKARVMAIRPGFVSLEVQPDSGANQAPQERAIQLYPDEVSVDTQP